MLRSNLKSLLLVPLFLFTSCLKQVGDTNRVPSGEIQPGSITSPGESENPDPPGPKGNAEGIEGRKALKFSSPLSRCEFKQVNQSQVFNVDCFAVAYRDEKTGEKVLADAAPGLDLEWQPPKLLEGAQVTDFKCGNAVNSLSYHCSLTLDAVVPTLVQFDLSVVEQATSAQKVTSNIVVLPRIVAIQDSLEELMGTRAGDALFPVELDFNKDGIITDEDTRILGLFPNLSEQTEGITAQAMANQIVSNCRMRVGAGVGHPKYLKGCDIDANSFMTAADAARLRLELLALLPSP